jgi:predicted dehydrogenase
VPDSLAVAGALACGATATYHLSEHAAFGPGHSIEIYGSRGALVYRLFADEILGATAGSTQLQPIAIPEEKARFQDTDAAFVRAIREGTRVSPDFEEGVRYMAFCEAVAYSVATGAAVSVPLAQPLMEAWGQLLD